MGINDDRGVPVSVPSASLTIRWLSASHPYAGHTARSASAGARLTLAFRIAYVLVKPTGVVDASSTARETTMLCVASRLSGFGLTPKYLRVHRGEKRENMVLSTKVWPWSAA